MTDITVKLPVDGRGNGGVLLSARASSYSHAMLILQAFLSQGNLFPGRSAPSNYQVRFEIDLIVND